MTQRFIYQAIAIADIRGRKPRPASFPLRCSGVTQGPKIISGAASAAMGTKRPLEHDVSNDA